MITVSDVARSLIDSGRFVYHVSASSWLGDQLLAESVPIVAGSEEGDRSLNVPDRITLTVPRRASGVDWTPTSDDSPLAAKDQTLKINLGIGQGVDGVEWFQRGEFLITETRLTSQQELSVTCAGLLTLVAEAKFPTPYQPTGTLGGTLRKLCEPAVLIDLTDAPSDRSIALTSIAWDTDRLSAVGMVLDAWPAEAMMTEQGVMRVYSATPPTVALKTYSDEQGGTVVSAAAGSVRGDPVDTLIVTGYTPAAEELRAISYDYDFRFRSRPATGIDLPRLTREAAKIRRARQVRTGLAATVAQASEMSKFMLSREMRRYAWKRLTVQTTPDPTVQLGDCVAVWAEGVYMLGTVETIQLPYRPGPMTIDVVELV